MKKKYNILFIADKSGFGGVQTIVHNLIDNYSSPNINVTYFFLRDINRKFDINTIKRDNVIYSKSYYKYNFKSFFELINIIRTKKIDALHMNGDKSTLYGFLLKKFYFPKIKLIHHEHFRIFHDNLMYNTMLKFAKEDIDLFIAVSKSTKLKLMGIGIPSKKIAVLYNFVDLNKFNRKKIHFDIKKEKGKLGISPGCFIIGFVGRLTKVKGCENLIKALPYLDFNYKVVIVGDGPLKQTLMHLAQKLGVNEKVLFLGYVNNPEHFYLLFDVLVIPSLHEASPMIFYESQSIGTPIIANDVPALNEFIVNQKNGLLFQKNNPSDLALKLSFIKDNHSLISNMTRIGMKVIKNYSINSYTSNLNKIYTSLLKNV